MNLKIYAKTESFINKMSAKNLTCYGLAKELGEDACTMYKIRDSKISVKVNLIKRYCEVLSCGFDDIFWIKQ
ncbi:MAG: helix-turn-helix domain-containing protein [Paraclostridium sp.]